LPPYLICDPEVKKQFEDCPGAAAVIRRSIASASAR